MKHESRLIFGGWGIKKPFLSLVIPGYNESKRIEASIRDLKSFFKTSLQDVEIIFVIEKSTDGTLELARRTVGEDPKFKLIGNDVQKGKGYAVKTGMLKSQGEIVIFMDLDLSTPLVEIFNFISHFQEHPETQIIIGSRQHEESEIIKKQHPLRQKMGQTFNFFVQLFAVKGITDTQCGFKAFRRSTVEPIFSRQRIDGFSFDVEILLIAQKLGYKIDVRPVKWVNSPDSKVRIVRDSLKMFFDLLQMRRLVRKTFLSLPVQKDQK
jgi:dolichyl-phosphate beta-glucosyltransferase